ncbi:MAG: tetratricopeptide repeat protein [Ignavibacteria bacterium]|nr:tetratricopeptide repeat protein [Ignavibacteria bacterium]
MMDLLRAFIAYVIISLIFMACSSSLQLQEYNSALNAYNDKKYQTAINFIDRAIEIDINESQFYVLRAKANYKIGNKNLAMDDLNKSIELANNFTAYHLRGKLFLEANELDKAKEDLRNAYEINSESADLLFDLGYLEYLNGENQLSLEYYIKASKYNSRNPNTYVNIGNLYAMMGDSKTAINNYSKALVLDTTEGTAYYNRATEKMLIGDFTGAIEDYESSLLIDSLNTNTLFVLAEAKTKLKDAKGAYNNYSKIILIDSTAAKAYYLLGVSEIVLEEYDKACKNFLKAGDLGYFDAYEMIKKYCDPKKKPQKKKVQKKLKR